MSLDPAAQSQDNATGRLRSRFSVPRGMTVGVLFAIAITWALYKVLPGSSLLSSQIQTGLFLGLFVLTICSRRAKVLVARTIQRYTLNPLMRLLLTIGVDRKSVV